MNIRQAQLPKGWEMKRFDDIIESNIIGLTKNSTEQNIRHKFKYVKMNNITKENCFDFSKFTCVNAEKDEVAKYSLSNGDFLFNTRNSYELVGKTCLFESYNDEVILYNNNIMRIRFSKAINPFFINYSFSTDDLIKKLDRLKSGTTNVSAIYYKDLKNLELLVPPLPEQLRIVSILDQAFAAIAKAKANAEQNLKNAKELFKSYLHGVFENGNENWEVKCLDELGTITSSKRIYKSEYVKDGVPFYRTKEIKELSNGKNITLELFISRERYEEIKKTFGVPQINDLLMSAVGTIGEIMVIENAEEFYFKDGNIVWFKEFKSIDTNYLKFALMAFVEKIKSLAIGAAYSALTIEKLNKYKISYPKSIDEQQAIVEKLDTLSVETKRLEAIYQQKINDLEELKKSVLQKAFNGELKTTKELAL